MHAQCRISLYKDDNKTSWGRHLQLKEQKVIREAAEINELLVTKRATPER